MTLWRMRFEWYLPNVPNTHRIYNIYCFSTVRVVALKRIKVAYPYVACLVWLTDSHLLYRHSAARRYVFKVVYEPSYCYTLLAEGQLRIQNDPLCPSDVEEFLTKKKQFAIGNNFLFTTLLRVIYVKPSSSPACSKTGRNFIVFQQSLLRMETSTLTEW
jgi:hypothetical protein